MGSPRETLEDAMAKYIEKCCREFDDTAYVLGEPAFDDCCNWQEFARALAKMLLIKMQREPWSETTDKRPCV